MPTPNEAKGAPDQWLSQICSGLGALGLPDMRRSLEEALATPAGDDSRLAWLWRLIEPQLRTRVERRIERRIREARLPVRNSLEVFSFSSQPELDRDLILGLATLRFHCDEVGLEQLERKSASRSGVMQKVWLPRYNARKATIIISNIPWESWGDYLDDHLGATALLDRLIHHSHVIVINGPSWRDHEHQQQIATPNMRKHATTSIAITARELPQ